MELSQAIKERRSIRVFSEKQLEKDDIHKIINAGQWAPSACNKQAWKFIAITRQNIKNDLVERAGSIMFVKKAPLTVAVLYHRNINKDNQANIQSAAAAIQNMLLTAHELGIGSVWVCSFGQRKIIKKLLKIPEQYRIVAFVCFGYPQINIKRIPARKKIKEVLSFNRFQFDDIYPNSHKLKDWSFHQAKNYFADFISASSPTADVYMKGFIGKEVHKQIDLVLPSLEKKDRVLEIFPYAGNFCLNILKRKRLDYSVLEFNQKNLSFLNERKKIMGIKQPIKEIITEEPKIPLPRNSVDKVLFFENIGSIPKHKMLVKEIHRVLRPGGKLFISFKNKHSFTWIYHKIFGKGDIAPLELIAPRYIKKLLKYFQINKKTGISLSPFGFGKKNKLGWPLSRIILIECKKNIN